MNQEELQKYRKIIEKGSNLINVQLDNLEKLYSSRDLVLYELMEKSDFLSPNDERITELELIMGSLNAQIGLREGEIRLAQNDINYCENIIKKDFPRR